jgi:hypothetical protein
MCVCCREKYIYLLTYLLSCTVYTVQYTYQYSTFSNQKRNDLFSSTFPNVLFVVYRNRLVHKVYEKLHKEFYLHDQFINICFTRLFLKQLEQSSFF